jgi:hypothetical protein
MPRFKLSVLMLVEFSSSVEVESIDKMDRERLL